jgi:hypothetical protein
MENLKIHLEYMGKEDGDIEDILSKVGLDDTGIQPVSTFILQFLLSCKSLKIP